jgi:hypothetical protein
MVKRKQNFPYTQQQFGRHFWSKRVLHEERGWASIRNNHTKMDMMTLWIDCEYCVSVSKAPYMETFVLERFMVAAYPVPI